VLVMVRAGVDPRPDKPDAAMVEAGPFRFSRNPIYLGFLLMVAGFALRCGDLWGWVALAAAHLVLDRLVVAKEEAYLATRFGAAYEAYRARVRRWV
jgi:protein-S-isoprenylcysteine O-methyltransferase Ste14